MGNARRPAGQRERQDRSTLLTPLVTRNSHLLLQGAQDASTSLRLRTVHLLHISGTGFLRVGLPCPRRDLRSHRRRQRPAAPDLVRQVWEFREQTGDGRREDLPVDHRLSFRKQRFEFAQFAGEFGIALVDLRCGDLILRSHVESGVRGQRRGVRSPAPF